MKDMKEFLKPDGKKVLILVLIIIIGFLDWIDLFSPRLMKSVGDVHLTPIIYPPVVFNEACIVRYKNEYDISLPYGEKVSNTIGWDCDASTWHFGSQDCIASCNLHPVSIIYISCYWYFLSCGMIWIYDKVKRK